MIHSQIRVGVLPLSARIRQSDPTYDIELDEGRTISYNPVPCFDYAYYVDIRLQVSENPTGD